MINSHNKSKVGVYLVSILESVVVKYQIANIDKTGCCFLEILFEMQSLSLGLNRTLDASFYLDFLLNVRTEMRLMFFFFFLHTHLPGESHVLRSTRKNSSPDGRNVSSFGCCLCSSPST